MFPKVEFLRLYEETTYYLELMGKDLENAFVIYERSGLRVRSCLEEAYKIDDKMRTRTFKQKNLLYH
jgi:hypothetical protein